MTDRASGPDRGAQAPTQAPVPPPATADEREQVIAAACDVLADRALARSGRRPDHPGRYLQAVRAGKITDHRRAATRLLVARPELTPEALADLLEPPGPTTGAPRAGDRLAPAGPDQRADQQRAARRRAADGMRQVRALSRQPLPADGPDQVAKLRRQLAAVQERLPQARPDRATPTDHTDSRDALRALRHLTREDQ